MLRSDVRQLDWLWTNSQVRQTYFEEKTKANSNIITQTAHRKLQTSWMDIDNLADRSWHSRPVQRWIISAI